MVDQDVWKNLPLELLQGIAQRLEFVDDVRSFSYVCKSWKVAVFELEPWLHSKFPCLLLAEDRGTGLSAVKVSNLVAILSEMDNPVDESECSEEDDILCSIHNLFRNNASSIRGWFSLATQKIYYLDLPEATDKLILGTNKEWLVTLGKDFEANLLHPLSRHQIPLPPMLTLPSQLELTYDDYQQHHAMFITKVVMSSELPRQSALQHQDNSDIPVIMASYTKDGILGFARLRDKFWTNVELETSASGIEDIVYHKKKFYAINFCGIIFMCDIDNKEWQNKGKIITSIPFEKDEAVLSYLIESLSGAHIWLVLRFSEGECYKEKGLALVHGKMNYYTISFKVFKLEVHHSSSDINIPTCTWTQEVEDLGSEALFIGRSSSVSVASSKYIKPNSIYFTDDSQFLFEDGGGHDMGIYNMRTGKIEPHFQGISIHNVSPSLWCM